MRSFLGKALNLFSNSKFSSGIWFYSLPVFFLLLADSAMSYIFPIVVETNVNSNTILGVIMALSSVAGLISDFTFPQLLKDKTWKFQLIAAIILTFFFPVSLTLGVVWSSIYLFIFGSIIWGIYWEFLNFSEQSYIIDQDKSGDYSKDWGVMYFVYQITTVIGPILGSLLIVNSLITANITISFIQVLSLFFAILLILGLPSKQFSHSTSVKHTLKIFKEVKYWEILSRNVWPVIIVGVTISSINAVFWTIGGLFGDLLFGRGLDWIVIVLFSAPSILGSLILTRIIIKKRKKKYSQIFLIIGCIFLSMIYFATDSILLILLLIILASFSLSFVGPLNDAVYSDLLDRLKKGRIHLLGLDKANTSLAYIIGPLLAGFLADRISYQLTLTIVGSIGAILGIILLLSTPRKLKLPQSKMKEMEPSVHTNLVRSTK